MKKLPSSWKVVKLSTLCDLQNGYAFQSKDYVESSNTLNCRMSNIRPDGVFDIYYNPKFLPDLYVEQYNKYLLKDGDVIIAMTDMATEAKILGVPTVVKTDGKSLLLNQRVGKLVINKPQLLHFPYLKYALSREEVRKYYLKFAGGGLQINLGKNDLLSVSIPLPPLEEQHRIAAILDKADAIRRKRAEAIRLTEELLRAAFLDMFGDPVTNPKWEVVNLGEHLSFVTTGPRGWAKYYSDMGERFIRSLDVRMNSISTSDAVFVNPPNNAEAKRACVKNDDVLLTMTGSRIGRVAPVPKDFKTAYISQHVAILRPLQTISPRYLSFFLSLPSGGQRQIASMQYGQTKPGLNLNQVCSFQVPLPPIEKQQEFDTFWLRYELLLNNLKTALGKSDKLFNSLLHRAFRGEL